MESKCRNLPKSSKKKLRMREEYLEKDFCIKTAQKLITNNDWKHVTADQIAKEIYGHAYVYYHWKWMEKLPLVNSMVYRHAEDGIDVEDKVDKGQMIWEWIWKMGKEP